MSDDKVKDLFTGKSVSEIEREEVEAKKDMMSESRNDMQKMIDAQQKLLDSGVLTGLIFMGTTETGIVTPYSVASTVNDELKFNFLADLFKDHTIGSCGYIFNVHGDEGEI